MRKTCASRCQPSRCPGSAIWELNATSALISRDPPWPIEESPSICWQCWRMRQPECSTMQQDATQLWSVERNIMHRRKVLKFRNVWGLWSNWPKHGMVQFGLSSTPLFTHFAISVRYLTRNLNWRSLNKSACCGSYNALILFWSPWSSGSPVANWCVGCLLHSFTIALHSNCCWQLLIIVC